MKEEISRQEFDDLKNNIKELKKVFEKINSIAMSTKKLAIKMKYMRKKQNCFCFFLFWTKIYNNFN